MRSPNDAERARERARESERGTIKKITKDASSKCLKHTQRQTDINIFSIYMLYSIFMHNLNDN